MIRCAYETIPFSRAAAARSWRERALAAESTEKVAPPPLPATPKRPVVSDYGDLKVSEDYRWLEDGQVPEVRAWADAQNQRARAFLARCRRASAIRARVATLIEVALADVVRSELARRPALRHEAQPPKQQPFLVVRSSADGAAAERVLLDPNARRRATPPSTGTCRRPTASSWPCRCRRAAARAATSTSTTSPPARSCPTSIPRVQQRHGRRQPGLDRRRQGFFYTRYPRGRERAAGRPRLLPAGLLPQARARRRERGPLRAGQGPAAHRRDQAARRDDGQRPAAGHVQNGDGGEFAYFLRDPDGKWTQFGDVRRQARAGRVRRRRRSLARLRRSRTRRAASCCGCRSTTSTLAKAKVVVPEGKDAIVATSSESLTCCRREPAVRHRLSSAGRRGCAASTSTASDGSPAPTQLPISDGRRPGARWPATTCCSPTSSSTSSRRPGIRYRGDGDEPVKTALATTLAGRLQRRRGGARVRHEQGRHEGAGQHPVAEGDEARRHEPVRC